MRIEDTKGINKYLKVQNKGNIKKKDMDSVKKTTKIEISSISKNIARKIGETEDRGYSDKVEAIKRTIAEGRYETSSEEIADKLVDKIIGQKASDK